MKSIIRSLQLHDRREDDGPRLEPEGKSIFAFGCVSDQHCWRVNYRIVVILNCSQHDRPKPPLSPLPLSLCCPDVLPLSSLHWPSSPPHRTVQ